jgi:hypothetical protein
MLAELQHRLQAAICEGADPGALLRGNELGLQAYRFAYRARLVEALQDNHPALHQALGDAAFTALTHAYLAEHPSSEPSIRWFGAQLADFMARLARAAAPGAGRPGAARLGAAPRLRRAGSRAAASRAAGRPRAMGRYGAAPAAACAHQRAALAGGAGLARPAAGARGRRGG